MVTADTGFANESNMKYLHENNINGYIPDNRFRERDPKFADQKEKYGKRHQQNKKIKLGELFKAKDFELDESRKTCICPAGESLSLLANSVDIDGKEKLFFKAKVLSCRGCELRHKCMKNPEASEHGRGIGRQVSFMLKNKAKPTFTDWMKERVDSKEGKLIYSHRMSVVEPVFGNIGSNKRLNRFSLRGKKKVNGQWKLFCLIQNIEKLKNYGELAA